MASPALIEQAALKVFGIPELAHLICVTVRKGDNVNLMRVCRELFYAILPFVWEELDEVYPLVSMIPGGDIVTYDSDWSPCMVMQLPDSLNLARFNIYAPHVKRLTPSARHIDEYNGWERFLPCTQYIDLLPNLETLCLPSPDNTRYTSNNRTVEVDSVNWVTTFLSTSLQTLVLAPREVTFFSRDALWLDSSLFHTLMTSVSWKCPHLRSLSILPASIALSDSTPRRRSNPTRHVSFSCNPPEIYMNFLQLRNLSSLMISPVILSLDTLVALSSLPCLETLCVLGYKNNHQVYCDHLKLPTEAFPALKHLELNRLTWRNIGNLCSAAPLVAGLHSLSIVYPSRLEVHLGEEQFTNLSDIIPLLAVSNSDITTLTVRDFEDHRISPEVLRYWKRLPLVNLHLGWSIKRYCGFGGLCSILSCLPLLEVLKLNMAQSAFDLRELRTIIEHLPRLCHIRIPVKWESVSELTEADFAPSQSQRDNILYLKSDFYLPGPQQENAKGLARYLSVLRPLALVICESYQPYSSIYATGNYIDEEPKDIINTELLRLRLACI
ncbi:unnamed protein product [Rhizoctonia solani]|uniref:Uncharacterized protein n=2 Tax=Rhizoctonia solani TaxID=456999 RepID=A0A8H2XYX6_9AGAM|nr:hypothetical protein V565_142270 [Rhizoctonia solani 123E]CAE6437363.1 unnamed protein product [Rhizoctonia solani]